MKKQFGVIILAAGNSTRMGKPKQSLSFKSTTFLKRILTTAVTLNCGPVIVVLGANADLLKEDAGNAITVFNELWTEGMSGSIRCGINKLLESSPSVEGTILTVCDQPYVTVSLLQQILDKYLQSSLPVVACSYGDTIGTPVLFHRSVFPELLQLQGDKGAKQIVMSNKERLGSIEFPLGSVDVDTEEDYRLLLQRRQ